MTDTVTIGTRGSELALWQTNWVKAGLEKNFPAIVFRTRTIKTTGDKILDVPLSKIGDKGLFTKELDNALLRGDIDLAVHSLKDLPTKIPPGLTIAAITRRWDPRDALVSRHGLSLDDLPQGAVIATGSLRRSAQLRHYRPDFYITDLRGNLNTRLRKFDDSDWDAMVLAVAGIERLGRQERITEKISFDIMLPAVGQGSFAVICREEDEKTASLVSMLNDREAQIAARAERALLRELQGGCQIPIGACARMAGNQLTLKACICSLDGRQMYRSSVTGGPAAAEEIGLLLANQLLEMGATTVLEEILAKSRV